MREVVLDTETTGLSFLNGDRIIEIGCVEIIDKRITGEVFHVLINPEREVSEEAFKITGLSYDFLKKFKTFGDSCGEFLEFIGNSRLVIHNAPFDIGFLNYELSQINVRELDPYNVVDTLDIAKEKYPGFSSTLDALCRRFSIDLAERVKHGALLDAQLLARVYLHMSVELLQKSIFESSNKSKEDYDDHIGAPLPKFELREFFPSEEEAELHEAFLEKLSNPIWKKLRA
ncbi:MAG: DNA polymerase III subunit epsilon [Holosporales bacterium]|jgi:DNA polymerase-3 subunit epsilon|nr:DNA polymerase III subunit epsilon [Holosporales bacterium]